MWDSHVVSSVHINRIVLRGAMAGWPVQWPHYLHQRVKTPARVWRQDTWEPTRSLDF